MRKVLPSIVVLITAVFAASAMAATSEVVWKDSDNYRDVKQANGADKPFKKRVFKSLEEHFSSLATKLPADHKLQIEVTNVDLAGSVQYVKTQELRVVKDVYIPRINLSYTLVDGSGKVVKSADVKIKDMSFMNQAKLNRDFLDYEKSMLTEWFSKTF